MGNAKEVEQNTDDAVYEPLTDAEKDKCKKIAKELGQEFCRRCGYCAPCPQGINIPQNLLLVNYKRKYGLGEWAKGRYHAMDATAKDCVKCGACETRCPYELPIRAMLEKVAEEME
jgi:predicted aldo/keto reductase-like oxidoreductase